MQTPSKRHLPIVGLVGLLVVAGAGSTVAYYQFVLSHPTTCAPPVHRLIFMTAIIYELGGFTVTKAAILNGTTMPAFDPIKGANLTGVNYQSYKLSDPLNKTINTNTGDTITLYIHSINANDTRQYGVTGHGFGTTANVVNGTSDTLLPFGKWTTITVAASSGGTFDFACTVACSDNHNKMRGSIVVGCG